MEDGLQLIRRFAKKQVRISKVWKNCHKIAILACQVFISTAAVKFSDDQRDIVEGLLDSYITICNTDNLIESFTTSLKRMSQLADASGLYVFCDVVHRKVRRWVCNGNFITRDFKLLTFTPDQLFS